VGGGPGVVKACSGQGVEGIVLKELKGRYAPGKRSESWRKVKCAAWLDHGERRLPGQRGHVVPLVTSRRLGV
jgi:hypothetical protein